MLLQTVLSLVLLHVSVFAQKHNFLDGVSPISRPFWNISEFPDISLLVGANNAEIVQGRCLVSISALPRQSRTQETQWHSGIWQPRTCARFVILGPSPLENPPSDRTNLTELLSKIATYKRRGYVPTQLVVGTASSGKPTYAAFMEFARSVDFEIWLPKNRTEAVEQYGTLVRRGFRLKTITGFERDSSSAIMGVWVKPDLSHGRQKVLYGLTLAKCMSADKLHEKLGYIPVVFQVYSVKGQPHCVGIWESGHGSSDYAIETDTNLMKLVQGYLATKPSYIPQQLSSYTDFSGKNRYFMLFSEYSRAGYPALWENRAIPKSYMPGSTDGFSSDDLQRIDNIIHEQMRYFHIPAATIAIVRDEKLKIAIAYGYANHATQELATWSTEMRIGSISKTMTAVGIFTLIQDGRLSLDQKLWGVGTIFGKQYGHQPYQPNLLAMTLRDLLAHTEGGWSGRENDGWTDPMYANFNITDDELISFVVDNYPLPFKPGVHWRYCNYGYFLLGKVIEIISEMPYKEFMHKRIVDPLGMNHTKLSPGVKLLPNESMYMENGIVDMFDYHFPMRRNWPDGGWVSIPGDLLRLSTRVDGFPLHKDILNAATLSAMTEPSLASNGTDSQGWSLNAGPNGNAPVWWRGWQHAGTSPSAYSILARGDDGLQFAYIQSGGYETHLDDFMTAYNAAKAVTAWPDHDLFVDSDTTVSLIEG